MDLLAVSDEVFHWATERCDFPSGSHGFLWPFIGALTSGQADGSLSYPGRVEDAADVAFNTACWGYVHLRHRHRWARKRARTQIAAVLLNGFATRRPVGASAVGGGRCGEVDRVIAPDEVGVRAACAGQALGQELERCRAADERGDRAGRVGESGTTSAAGRRQAGVDRAGRRRRRGWPPRGAR